jgi:hypothetical protein
MPSLIATARISVPVAWATTSCSSCSETTIEEVLRVSV